MEPGLRFLDSQSLVVKVERVNLERISPSLTHLLKQVRMLPFRKSLLFVKLILKQ